MDCRVTYFVSAAERTAEGWAVQGEPGLGPPRVGDRFSWVLHRADGTEERDELEVVELGAASLRLVGGLRLRLRCDDILGGEVER